MTEPEPELYVPKPGLVPWKVLSHLMENPAAELQRKHVAALCGCPGPSVDAMLQTATARECLIKGRNSAFEVIWRLGDTKRFRLDPLPQASSAPAPATAQPYQAIKVVELPKPPAPPAEKITPPDPVQRPAAEVSVPFNGPVMVVMPKHLTHELIEAVKADPSTSFDCNADMHHAIGWLSSAYEVMVKKQISRATQ